MITLGKLTEFAHLNDEPLAQTHGWYDQWYVSRTKTNRTVPYGLFLYDGELQPYLGREVIDELLSRPGQVDYGLDRPLDDATA